MEKNVVLVFPRFKYPSGDFSLGLATVAAYVRAKIPGIKLSILDTTFNPSLDYAKQFLEKAKPDIVGVSMDTLMFNDAVKVARIAKELGANVIAGGPHPTVMPGTAIKEDCFDAICIGEGELTLKEYIETFYGSRLFEKVKGIWFKKKGKVMKNPPRDPIENIDEIPFMAYDLFDMDQYLAKFVQLDSYNPGLKGVSIIISRGCPFNCSYCQPTLRKVFGKKVRLMSPQRVIEELKFLKKRYDIDAFYFTDDTFTAFKKWVKEFCELMKKERLELLWCCNTRADTIDLETLQMMKEVGLIKVKVGIESITDRIRNGIYNKNISKKQIQDLLDISKKLGIQVTGFFMLGAPSETPKEVWDTIRFAARSSLMEANFSIATPLPETGLYNYVVEKGWTVPTSFDCYDYYQVKRPQMSKDEISIEKLVFYKKLANFYFYLHPRRILNTLRSMWGLQGLKKLMLTIEGSWLSILEIQIQYLLQCLFFEALPLNAFHYLIYYAFLSF